MEQGTYTYSEKSAGSVGVSPFDALASAVDNLHENRKFSESLADRLAGPQPPMPASGVAKLDVIGGGGLLDGVDRSARTINDLVATIRLSLSRIEQRL